MKKQKSVIEKPDLPEQGLENTGKKQKVFKVKRLENNKRKIYLAGLLLCVVLVLLFVRYARHLDDRSMDIEPNPSDITPREDITGKEPVTVKLGKYVAGVDIEPGRYMVTAENGYGSFVTYEIGTSYPEISELLGYFADSAYVPSVAVTLVESQVIEIKGERLKGVIFTPLATELLSELTTGIWVVGLDIEPGTYTISSKDGRSGSVTLLEENSPVGRVLLGEGGANYRKSATITLVRGQTIRISNIPVVLFEK